MEKKLGDIIVSRTYLLNGTKITLYIGKPQPFNKDYYCPYLIDGTNSYEIKYIYGVDALQSLQLALQIIGIEINLINKDYNRKLSWFGGEEGDTGFPED